LSPIPSAAYTPPNRIPLSASWIAVVAVKARYRFAQSGVGRMYFPVAASAG